MWKLVARDSNENEASSSQVRQSNVNPCSSAGEPVAKTTKNPDERGLFPHNLDISRSNVHLEKVDSNVRQKLGRPQNDESGTDRRQRNELENV